MIVLCRDCSICLCNEADEVCSEMCGHECHPFQNCNDEDDD